MKILYLCNNAIPYVSTALGKTPSVFGGWMARTIDGFRKDNTILFMCPGETAMDKSIDPNFRCIIFNKKNDLTDLFDSVLREFLPDVVHIWGSEFAHSYYMSEALARNGMSKKAVLSIQGLIGEIAKVYDRGLPSKVVNKWSLGDIFRGGNIRSEKRNFDKRGQYEKKTIANLNNVIGRTAWDETCVKSINKNIKYFFCGESLRETFYDGDRWSYDKCKRHSIFVCQASYPIKGFVFAVEILQKLREKYPDAVLITTGKPFVQKSVMGRLKQSSYQRFIRKKIVSAHLQNNIICKGTLSDIAMKQELLQANVVLSPSVIENSPNSIGEAMMLGVPVVASNVGGVSSIISDNEGWLYDADNIEAAVSYIDGIFEYQGNEKQAEAMSRAKKQYDFEEIMVRMKIIYREVADNV